MRCRVEVLRDDPLGLRRDRVLDLLEDLPPELKQLLPVDLALLDLVPHGLGRGLLHGIDRDRGEVDDVVEGVLQELPGRLVLDLLRLGLDLGPGEADVVDRVGPGEGDHGEDDVRERVARCAGNDVHVHVFTA